MKKLSIKQFILGNYQILSMKISKNLAIYFLLIISIFSILTLPRCATTYGKSPKILANDEIIVKIYKSAVAKQEVAEVKLKELIDKVLTENHYVDYVLLYQVNVTNRIKFFRTIQDKLMFLSNIQNIKYLDSLMYNSKGQYTEIAKQVLLFKSNDITFENITNNKLIMSKSVAGASCSFAKGGGKYFLVMNYASFSKDFRDKHILNINLNNGSKIQLSPFDNLTSKDENNSMILFSVNPDALTLLNIHNNIKLVTPSTINISYKLQDCLYQISLEQLQEMSKYEMTSILLSFGPKEFIEANHLQNVNFIKNDAKYILVN